MEEMKGLSEDGKKQAMAFAQSEAGQQLLAMLQRTHGQQLQTAMQQASAGNYDAVKRTISSLMQDPEAKKLLDSMRK